MKSKKLRRRALLTSIMSLVLCCAMLVGTTFAWFTDSVTSANNIIKSGNLDVTLEYWNKDEGKYVEVTEKTALFNSNALWEPGYTEVAYLKVGNAGSLALKYQLGVNVVEEITGLTKDNKEIKLSEHLVFTVVESETDLADAYKDNREAAKAAAGTELGLKDYNSGTKVLEKTGAAAYVALIIYMPESVGNEANHNGKNVPSIEMGVNLVATQVENESDSFDNTYDEGAWAEGFKVYNGNDLQDAIDAGETNIVLMDNITLNEGLVIPAPATTTYSLRSAFNGIIIDLNGKNITIEAAYDDAKATASSAVVNNGSLKLTGNGTIKAANNYTVRNYGTMVIDGVTVENGVMNYGDLTVERGNISNSRSGKHTIYGNDAKLTINGGTFHNGNPGNATIFSYAGEVVINGGEFTIADGTATPLGWTSCLLDAQGNAKFTINGGFVNGEIRDYNKNTLVYGGTFGHSSVKNFVAAGYKAVKTSDGWMVIPGSANYVTNSEELVKAIKETADGGTILMAAGEFAVRFTNDTTFNADNLTFKGMEGTKLSVSSSEVWYGRVQGDNVVFENIEFTSSVGTTGKATYNNCTFSGDWTICASGSNAETYINNCTINGCLNTSVDFSSGDAYVKNSTIAKAEYSGSATMNFENCKIGELIVWNMNTNLVNTTVETMDLSVTTAVIMIDGYKYLADGLGVDSNDVYGVSSAKGLVALNAMMADRKAGKGFKVELLTDIDMTGEVWTTVDSHVDGGCYISEFDGNGHTISNLTINGQAMFSRFAGSGDVVIKDVTFDKANVNSNGNINTSILTVQSYQNVLLDNVDVTNSTITGGYKVAPLIATVYNESSTSITATLKNCDVSNTTVTATVYDFCTTGMVAFVREKGDNDKVVFENCTVSKVTLVAPDDSYKAHAWIYVNDADTDDKFNAAEGVTVSDCVFQNP